MWLYAPGAGGFQVSDFEFIPSAARDLRWFGDKRDDGLWLWTNESTYLLRDRRCLAALGMN